MALLLSNAILHIVDNGGAGSCFSNVELEVDSETCYEFVGKHVRRLVRAPAAREGTFRPESAVYGMVKAYQRGEMAFKDLSLFLADRLNAILRENRDIPPGDLLVSAFDWAKKRYLALVMLPWGECYMHRVVDRPGGAETQLIKAPNMLPASGGKVAEACLIPYDPMVLRVTEQQYPVNGEMCGYFSHLFLECDTEISKKETAQLIQDIATEVNAIYYDGDIDMEARIKCALVEEAPEDPEECLDLESAAKTAYGENQGAVEHFVGRVQDSGLPHAVPLSRPFVEQQFRVQRIKADNGIELKIPLALSQDPDAVRIESNQDGTVSITLKNLRTADL